MSGDNSKEHSDSFLPLGDVLVNAHSLTRRVLASFFKSNICLAKRLSFFLIEVKSLSLRLLISSISSFFLRFINAIFSYNCVILFLRLRFDR